MDELQVQKYDRILIPRMDTLLVQGVDSLLGLIDGGGKSRHLVVLSHDTGEQLDKIIHDRRSDPYEVRSAREVMEFIRNRAQHNKGHNVFPLEQGSLLDIYIGPPDQTFDDVIVDLHNKAGKTYEQKVTVISNSDQVVISYLRRGIHAEPSQFDKIDPKLVLEGVVQVSHDELLAELFSEQSIPIADVSEALDRPYFEYGLTKRRKGVHYLYPNQVVDFSKSEKKPVFALVTGTPTNVKPSGDYDLEDVRLEYIDQKRINEMMGRTFVTLKPRSVQQAIAMHFMTNSRYRSVFINGGAGTGKTVISYAAALSQILGGIPQYPDMDNFRTAVITKNAEAMEGQHLGFRKGTIDDKILPIIQSYEDAHTALGLECNLKYLMMSPLPRIGQRRRESNKIGKSNVTLPRDSSAVEFQSLEYVRGLSLSEVCLIVDEIQNFPPYLAKAILTRPAHGSKTLVMGDLKQIDNIHLRPEYNGFLFAVHRYLGHPTTAMMTLKQNERSIQSLIADGMRDR